MHKDGCFVPYNIYVQTRDLCVICDLSDVQKHQLHQILSNPVAVWVDVNNSWS